MSTLLRGSPTAECSRGVKEAALAPPVAAGVRGNKKNLPEWGFVVYQGRKVSLKTHGGQIFSVQILSKIAPNWGQKRSLSMKPILANHLKEVNKNYLALTQVRG